MPRKVTVTNHSNRPVFIFEDEDMNDDAIEEYVTSQLGPKNKAGRPLLWVAENTDCAQSH